MLLRVRAAGRSARLDSERLLLGLQYRTEMLTQPLNIKEQDCLSHIQLWHNFPVLQHCSVMFGGRSAGLLQSLLALLAAICAGQSLSVCPSAQVAAWAMCPESWSLQCNEFG